MHCAAASWRSGATSTSSRYRDQLDRARQCGVVVVTAARRSRWAVGVGAARRKVDRRQATRRDPLRESPRGGRDPTWSDRADDDEIAVVGGMRVTTPARTALDLACRYPVNGAVAMIDALARATRLKVADVELLAERYKGRRGIRRAHSALALVDGGAESPRETWLRLLLVRAGCPPPQTQIAVYDEYGAGRRGPRYELGGHQGRRGVPRATATEPTDGNSRRTSAARKPPQSWVGLTSGLRPRTRQAASSPGYQRPGSAERETVAIFWSKVRSSSRWAPTGCGREGHRHRLQAADEVGRPQR